MAEEEAPVSTAEATEVDTPAVTGGDAEKPKVSMKSSVYVRPKYMMKAFVSVPCYVVRPDLLHGMILMRS